MPKTKPKIHVMRHKLQLDIEVDPTSLFSVDHAAEVMTSINAHVAGLDRATLKITDSRLARVDAPEPKAEAPKPEPAATEPNTEFVDDGVDIPAALERRAETDTAAAE